MILITKKKKTHVDVKVPFHKLLSLAPRSSAEQEKKENALKELGQLGCYFVMVFHYIQLLVCTNLLNSIVRFFFFFYLFGLQCMKLGFEKILRNNK